MGLANRQHVSRYNSLAGITSSYNMLHFTSMSPSPYSRLNDYRSSKKKWDLSRLPKFEKDFYKESPIVAARSDVSVGTKL